MKFRLALFLAGASLLVAMPLFAEKYVPGPNISDKDHPSRLRALISNWILRITKECATTGSGNSTSQLLTRTRANLVPSLPPPPTATFIGT